MSRARSFKIIRHGQVIPAPSLEAVAQDLAAHVGSDPGTRVRACTSLTQDRDLTTEEFRAVVRRGTELFLETRRAA